MSLWKVFSGSKTDPLLVTEIIMPLGIDRRQHSANQLSEA